jgi:hypothetical protein
MRNNILIWQQMRWLTQFKYAINIDQQIVNNYRKVSQLKNHQSNTINHNFEHRQPTSSIMYIWNSEMWLITFKIVINCV